MRKIEQWGSHHHPVERLVLRSIEELAEAYNQDGVRIFRREGAWLGSTEQAGLEANQADPGHKHLLGADSIRSRLVGVRRHEEAWISWSQDQSLDS